MRLAPLREAVPERLGRAVARAAPPRRPARRRTPRPSPGRPPPGAGRARPAPPRRWDRTATSRAEGADGEARYGRVGPCSAGRPVSASAPIVDPWYACAGEMTRQRSGFAAVDVVGRASRSAVSFASDPPDTKRTRAISGATTSISRSASALLRLVGEVVVVHVRDALGLLGRRGDELGDAVAEAGHHGAARAGVEDLACRRWCEPDALAALDVRVRQVEEAGKHARGVRATVRRTRSRSAAMRRPVGRRATASRNRSRSCHDACRVAFASRCVSSSRPSGSTPSASSSCR